MENYTNHFYNNVFFNSSTNYQSPPCTLYFGGGSCGDGVGSLVLNNAFVTSGGLTVYTAPVTVSYNAWDSTTYGRMGGGGWAVGTSNLTVTLSQLGFVNATNYPYDFHLTSSSILRGAGQNLSSDTSATTVDLDGVSRPASTAWDIGPFQYVSGTTNIPGTNAVLWYELNGISGGGFSL